MAIVGCWFLGSLKAFLSPLPPLHTPPDAAWFCPVTTELGVHSRVTAAPLGQEPEIPRSLGPKAGQRLRNERVEGGGWRNEVCLVEQGRNLGSPRHWETLGDNLALPPLLPTSGQKRRHGSFCPTHHWLPFCALFPSKTCLGVYSLVPFFYMLVEGWGAYPVI